MPSPKEAPVTRDRIESTQPDAPPLFRIAGVEPHGWSTVLVEEQSGRAFLLATATGRLTEIAPAQARALLADRSYRAWQGDRDWAPLDSLPLIDPGVLPTGSPATDHAPTASS
jgi:hypothetical protein